MGLTVLISAVIVFLLSLYGGVSLYIASTLTSPAETPVKYDKKLIGERVADVVFRSKDNVQLAGWYFRGVNDKAIIFVHGAGNQNRANEVYGAPEIAKHFYEQGYSLLMFDLRGIGESQKVRISFGQHEADDVAGAYNYLIKQEFKPESIGIISDSLGAIATIMAGNDIKDAGAVVLDSPASEIKSIVSNIMEDDHSVPRFLHPGSFLAARLFFDIDIDRVRPIDKISLLGNTPLLFLHGESDTLIAPSNSEELFNMVTNAKRVTFPNTGHVETYIKNPDKYLELLDAFFEENLKD